MSGKKATKSKLPKIPPFPDVDNHMDLSQNTLLSTLLNDPASRAMVLQFMAHAEKDIKYKEDQTKKVEDKLKKNRFMCESPTAQFRKKELRRLKSANSDSEGSSTSSTTEKDIPRTPFHELLRGLVIYVEVFSNGFDKSLSAKALVQSMGAKVSDRIAREVTHVIFKDGSYQTYKLAKSLKMHVVSILWLQAVKRKGNRVPEKDYPAFGADQGDLNVSTMCKNLQAEFDDVCQDERAKLTSSNTNSTVNKTLAITPKNNEIIDKNVTPCTTTFCKKSLFDDSDDDDGSVFLSAKSSRSSVISSAKSSTKLPSDFSSHKGLINGETSKNLNDSLELTSNILEKTTEPTIKQHRRRTLYNPEENTMIEINMSKNKRKTMFAVPVLRESNRNLNRSLNSSNNDISKENNMEITCLEDTTAKFTDSTQTTEETESLKIKPIRNSSIRRSKTSLESNDSSINSSARSSINSTSMDITSFVNTRRRSVRIASKSEEIFKKPVEPGKDSESKESSFSDKLSSLRLSTESMQRESIEGNEKLATSSDSNILQSDNITSSLSVLENDLSVSTSNDNNKRTPTAISRKKVSFDNNILQSQNLTSSLRLSDSQQLNNKQESDKMSTDSPSDKLVSCDSNILEPDNLTSSVRLSVPQQSNNKSSTSELMGEMSQLRIDSVDNSVEISSLHLSESVKETSKKRLSDEEPPQVLTLPKKNRPDTAKPKQKTLSESSSDGSGKKKFRKLYDVDADNNSDLLLQIECPLVEPKNKITKGRVKRAMELIAKPFELTPECERGKLKSICSDSEDESDSKRKTNSKIAAKKRLTGVQSTKPKTANAPIPSTSSNKGKEVFATPKTPKKAPGTPSRRSSRFTTPVTYKQYYDADKTLNESVESNKSVITPKFNRRSTMDFSTPISTTPLKSQRGDSISKKGVSKSGIACTRFKVGRVNTFAHIVRRLGRFHIDDNVIARTTHLVVGENKRTVNLLRAIARGCWILSADWLYKSMAAGKWLPEEDYEFTDFSDAVQFCRKEREAFGLSYTTDIFAGSGTIYIARRGTKPTYDELRELVQLAGGTVAPSARGAAIVVGEVVKRYDTVQWCVSELWLLDSITRNEMAPCREYSLLAEEEVLGEGARRERRLSEDY